MWTCDPNVALSILTPRYDVDKRGRAGKRWPVDGNRMQLNVNLTPKHVDKLLKALIAKWDRSGQKDSVQWFDVHKAHRTGKLWTLQRTCKAVTIAYMMKNWRWQRWKVRALPIYLIWGEKVIVWNGTHRTIPGILANKKIRARVLDLNAFAVWMKKNPDESMWNVKRVVKVKPKKGKRRGR